MLGESDEYYELSRPNFVEPRLVCNSTNKLTNQQLQSKQPLENSISSSLNSKVFNVTYNREENERSVMNLKNYRRMQRVKNHSIQQNFDPSF